MFTLRLSWDAMSSLARKSMVITHISSIVRFEFTDSFRGEEEIAWQSTDCQSECKYKLHTCLG